MLSPFCPSKTIEKTHGTEQSTPNRILKENTEMRRTCAVDEAPGKPSATGENVQTNFMILMVYIA